MGVPQGFEHTVRGSGEVVVRHHGAVATVLRGGRAAKFLAELDGCDASEAQALMARITGNYRRGNERRAAQHPRNRR